MDHVRKCSRQFGRGVLLLTISIALGFAPALSSDVNSSLHYPVLMLWLLIVLTLGGTGFAFYHGAFLLSPAILKAPQADSSKNTDERKE